MTRFLAVLLILLACVWCIYANYVMPPVNGTWGYLSQKVVGANLRDQRVTKVYPDSPAAQAGIAPGDIVRTLAARYFPVTIPVPGQRSDFQVTHGSARRTVTLVAGTIVNRRPWTESVLFACEILSLALALLLVARRWNDPNARILALYFVLQAATLAPHDNAGVFRAIFLFYPSIVFCAYGAFLVFTGTYPVQVRSSRVRAVFAWGSSGFTLGMAALLLVSGICADWFWLDVVSTPNYRLASLVCADILPALSLVVGIGSTSGPVRKRLATLFAFYLIGAAGPIAYDLILAHGGPRLLGSTSLRPLLATLVIAYAGYAYVIVRQRLVDIGFVLNRATIYAVLTIVLVPIFALLEWLAESYVSGQSRTENFFIQGGIVILLFALMRWLHEHAEHFVDTLLFRKRYEDEEALRAFARQVVFMTDAGLVSDKTVQLVNGRSDASWVALYTREGAHAYRRKADANGTAAPREIDENDLAVTAMLAERAPIDHPHYSALSDALVLPCIAHAELVGFLACGSKNGGESYAPDERDALAQVARAVGITFDALRLAALEREVARLRALIPGQ